MTIRERILAIRLLEKQQKNSAYAKQLGIQIRMIQNTSILEDKHD